MNRATKTTPLGRFLLVWVLLAATALFLHARSSYEYVPAHRSLDAFPRELQGWTGTDFPMDAEVLQVLGPGDFLNRTYRNASARAPIELFVAYYASQKTGDTIHSPQNCLPGAGWTPLEKRSIQILRGGSSSANEVAATANRYVFAKGMERMLVLYWYQAHGRTTPSEYWAKFYLVKDAIATRRTDGAMVRMVTPIAGSSDEAEAEERAVKFAQMVLAELDSYVPR